MRRQFAILIPVLLAVAFSLWSCSRGDYSGPVESITLGYTPSEAAGLVYISENRGFFTGNGVKIIHKYYNTGAEVMEGLLKGEVEIAGMSEFPFIIRVFEKQKISVYASLDKLQYIYLIGRKDRGIQSAGDLKGKRIGLPMGTIAEFCLGRYLELNGLTMKDVSLVNTAPPSAMEALGGNLDGVVVWNPFTYQIKQRMANRAAILRVQSNQPAYALAVSRNDRLASQKQLIKRSLKAIAQAEQYVVNYPSEARAIVQKRMNYDDAVMESVWPENQFSLSLDQSLITAMEDEARWMIKNKMTTEKQVPDFLNYIYVDGLKAVKPEAVNIIR